ncbi:MAG: glycosyltransferase family 39 protein, partial [Elusimicrobiota bacterium]|nr:glycosyltransferase family 39 protein [Elusimicrobiota bacterium]
MNKKNLAVVLIILIAGMFYSLNIKPGQIGHLNDDAYYINAARWFAGVQTAQKELSSRSLGFAFLLVPVARVAGDSLLPFRMVSLLFTLASLWMIFLIFRKKTRANTFAAAGGVCFSILLLTAFNHMNLIFSTMVMSEEAYLFFSLLALWLFIRYENRDFSYRASFCQALSLAVLSYIRPEGFLMAFAVFVILVFSRRNRDALYTVFFFILLVLPLVTNSFGIGSSLDKYLNELLFPMLYAGPSAVLKTNSAYFLKDISAVSFFTEVIRSRMGIFEIYAALVVMAVILLGLWTAVRKRGKTASFRSVPSVFAVYFVLYTVFHMIWPAKGVRFVIPILPFIYYFFFSAIDFAVSGSSIVSRRKATVFFTTLILIVSAYQNYLILITPVPELFPETFAYVKSSNKKEDVFVSETADRFFLKTGVKTILPVVYTSPDDFYYFLIKKGVTRAALYRNLLLSTEYKEFPTPSAGGIKRYAMYVKNTWR